MTNLPLVFKPLDLPPLLESALHLPSTGQLKTWENHWTYLDIDDRYIHDLFPLLVNHPDPIHKPQYFGENLAGAHITVFYPEENIFVHNKDLHKEHSFTVQGAFTADLDSKRYFVLKVEAPSLLALRNQYGLGDQLCFKRHSIDLHITIGTQVI